MKKGIKIKVLTVFMAWVVIFLHSVIPHQHQHDTYSEIKSIVHFTSSEHNNSQILNSLGIHDSDHDNVCRYADNLFHQLNSENLLPVLTINIHIIPSTDLDNNLCYDKEAVIPDFILYPNSLRAPPVS